MITSISNPLVKTVRALNAGSKERREQGLFVAEGIKIFSETPADRIEKVLVSESFSREGKIPGEFDIEILSDELFERISDTRTPQGVMTIVRQRTYRKEELFQKKDPFLMLLEDVRDPGNLGTIVRTAEGAGVDGLILSRGCADIYQPKVIRSTMGSIYRVPFTVCEDCAAQVKEMQKRGIRVYAAHLAGSMDYTEPDYKKGTAFVIGNEANGISEELTKCCTALIRIPMKGELESLNAAVSAAILMYTVNRQRS